MPRDGGAVNRRGHDDVMETNGLTSRRGRSSLHRSCEGLPTLYGHRCESTQIGLQAVIIVEVLRPVACRERVHEVQQLPAVTGVYVRTARPQPPLILTRHPPGKSLYVKR